MDITRRIHSIDVARGVAMVLMAIDHVRVYLAAMIISALREGSVNSWLFANHPTMNPPPPDGYMWPLWLLYPVFILVVALLYFPSRWYWTRKTTRPARWMRYI